MGQCFPQKVGAICEELGSSNTHMARDLGLFLKVVRRGGKGFLKALQMSASGIAERVKPADERTLWQKEKKSSKSTSLMR